jgi:hypothetical protein
MESVVPSSFLLWWTVTATRSEAIEVFLQATDILALVKLYHLQLMLRRSGGPIRLPLWNCLPVGFRLASLLREVYDSNKSI